MKSNPPCPQCGALQNDEGICPRCEFAVALEPFSPPAWEPATSSDNSTKHFGDYELLEELGHGGMGVVYKARHVKLNRMVALKLLLLGQFSSEQAVKRFQREAQAAAALRHPNIVGLHDVGEVDGQHYFTMELVEGRSLASLLQDGPVSPRVAAEYCRAIARAIDVAHKGGIIHRDLKPSNILIDLFDQPRISDFGLAKRLDGSGDITLTGHVLGSPNYLAPELAAGREKESGPGTDIFSIGAILYECLTGRPPFLATTLQETLLRIRDQEPVAPRVLNAKLPRDLETICLKCLEKEPSRRYTTARELADELDRYLKHEPIRARPISKAERSWRWCRRNPVLASFVTATAALFVAVAIGAPVSLYRIKTEAAARRLQLYSAEVNLAGQALADDDIVRARNYLKRQIPSKGQKDLRGFEWRYLAAQTRSDETATLGHHNTPVRAVRFSPDGKYLASSDEDGTVVLWDWRSRKSVAKLIDPTLDRIEGGLTLISPLAFSRDGQTLAVGAFYEVLFWDVASRRLMTAIKGERKLINFLLYLPDNHTMAVSGADGTIRFFNTGEKPPMEIGRIQTKFNVQYLVCSHDGKTLMASVNNSVMRRWNITDLRNPTELPMLKAHTGHGMALAISPTSNLVVAPSSVSELVLWTLSHDPLPLPFERIHSPRTSIGLPGGVAFTPDGRTIVLGGCDHNITLWDVAGRKGPVKLRGHEDGINCIDVSPDGKTVASGSNDKSVRLWDIAKEWEQTPSIDHGEFLMSLAVSPDSKLVASGSQDGILKLTEIENGHVLVSSTATNAYGRYSVSFSSDSKTLAAEVSDSIHLRRVPSLEDIEVFPGAFPQFKPMSGELVYFRGLGNGGELRSRDLKTRIERATKIDWSWLSRLIVSPNGRSYAASHGRQVRVWNEESTSHPYDLDTYGDQVWGLAFSPSNDLLACASWDGTVGLYNVSKIPKLIFRWTPHKGMAWSVAFSPDGKSLATSGDDGVIRLWNLSSLQEALVLVGHTGPVVWIAFSADGNHLASGDNTGVVRLWNAPPTIEAASSHLKE